MKTFNKAATAIIRKHGYVFFCEYRRCRLNGWGMQKAMSNAKLDVSKLAWNDDE